MRLLRLLSFSCIFLGAARPEVDTTSVQALGAWEGSVATWDRDAFGSDAPTELLLYIQGQTFAGERSHELVITNADLEIHFQSGINSITRCFSPRDELKSESIACERDIPGVAPAQIFLENHDGQQWSGLISWRRHSVPITFTRPRMPAEAKPTNELAGDWRSSDRTVLLMRSSIFELPKRVHTS